MIKSKTVLLFMALFCVCLVGPILSVNAATLTLELNTAFPGKPDPLGDPPWLTAFFDDGGTSGSVYLTMSADLLWPNRVKEWYFNLDEAFDPEELSFFQVARSGFGAPWATGFITDPDDPSLKANGDGYFDILFQFPTVVTAFNNTDWLTYLITSPEAITASSFGVFSAPGGGEGTWLSAAHIQNLCVEDSTWIGAVPVPPSIFLFGSGLIGVVGLARRRIFG